MRPTPVPRRARPRRRPAVRITPGDIGLLVLVTLAVISIARHVGAI